jgi:hypothetical protein
VNKGLAAGTVIAALVAVGGTLYVLSAREREAAVLERIADASRCVASGRYDDPATLALALRYRHHADANVDVAARAWPQTCAEPLSRLNDAVEKWSGGDEARSLAAAVTRLREAVTTPYVPERVGATLAAVSAALVALWDAAAAAGIDVEAVVPPGTHHAPATLTLSVLSTMPTFADRPVELATLGSHHEDSRQARYSVIDATTHDVVGYCSLPLEGASACVAIPEALRDPKTQLLGYTEPATMPLLYARDEGRTWSVYRGDDGQRLFTGFAGGAWASDGYAATVTDDKGREDRIVVVEQRGKGAPIERRVIELKDIDPQAERVGQAIVIWQNVLVRTKRSDQAGSSFFCLPLPLAPGPIEATKVGEGAAVDFCRGKDAVYVSDRVGHHAFRDGAWHPAPAASCPALEGAEAPIFERGGALWRREGEGSALFLDPFFVDGAFVEESQLERWSYLPPRLVVLQVGTLVHVVELAERGAVRALGALRGSSIP